MDLRIPSDVELLAWGASAGLFGRDQEAKNTTATEASSVKLIGGGGPRGGLSAAP
jgi:hypothetical protein